MSRVWFVENDDGTTDLVAVLPPVWRSPERVALLHEIVELMVDGLVDGWLPDPTLPTHVSGEAIAEWLRERKVAATPT